MNSNDVSKPEKPQKPPKPPKPAKTHKYIAEQKRLQELNIEDPVKSSPNVDNEVPWFEQTMAYNHNSIKDSPVVKTRNTKCPDIQLPKQSPVVTSSVGVTCPVNTSTDASSILSTAPVPVPRARKTLSVENLLADSHILEQSRDRLHPIDISESNAGSSVGLLKSQTSYTSVIKSSSSNSNGIRISFVGEDDVFNRNNPVSQNCISQNCVSQNDVSQNSNSKNGIVKNSTVYTPKPFQTPISTPVEPMSFNFITTTVQLKTLDSPPRPGFPPPPPPGIENCPQKLDFSNIATPTAPPRPEKPPRVFKNHDQPINNAQEITNSTRNPMETINSISTENITAPESSPPPFGSPPTNQNPPALITNSRPYNELLTTESKYIKKLSFLLSIQNPLSDALKKLPKSENPRVNQLLGLLSQITVLSGTHRAIHAAIKRSLQFNLGNNLVDLSHVFGSYVSFNTHSADFYGNQDLKHVKTDKSLVLGVDAYLEKFSVTRNLLHDIKKRPDWDHINFLSVDALIQSVNNRPNKMILPLKEYRKEFLKKSENYDDDLKSKISKDLPFLDKTISTIESKLNQIQQSMAKSNQQRYLSPFMQKITTKYGQSNLDLHFQFAHKVTQITETKSMLNRTALKPERLEKEVLLIGFTLDALTRKVNRNESGLESGGNSTLSHHLVFLLADLDSFSNEKTQEPIDMFEILPNKSIFYFGRFEHHENALMISGSSSKNANTFGFSEINPESVVDLTSKLFKAMKMERFGDSRDEADIFKYSNHLTTNYPECLNVFAENLCNNRPDFELSAFKIPRSDCNLCMFCGNSEPFHDTSHCEVSGFLGCTNCVRNYNTIMRSPESAVSWPFLNNDIFELTLENKKTVFNNIGLIKTSVFAGYLNISKEQTRVKDNKSVSSKIGGAKSLKKGKDSKHFKKFVIINKSGLDDKKFALYVFDRKYDCCSKDDFNVLPIPCFDETYFYSIDDKLKDTIVTISKKSPHSTADKIAISMFITFKFTPCMNLQKVYFLNALDTFLKL